MERIFEMNHIDSCDLMKVDCEGAEYEILMTAPRTVLARIKRIILEWHQVDGKTPEVLERYLNEVGFKTHRPKHRFIVADNTLVGASPV